MTIEELREKRAEKWENAKAYLEAHRGENGVLSAEDDAKYTTMEKEIEDMGKEITRLERQAQIDDEMARPVDTPVTSKPGAGAPNMKTGRASDEYKNALERAMRTKFRQVSDILQEGTDADGGYLVPEEYDTRLIVALEGENIMRQLGTVIKTSGERKINIASTKPAAAWIDEGEELTFGDATFDQILLDAHKLHVAVKVTEELLYDNAYDLESYITDQFGKALANAEEDAFLNGSGSGEPLGLFAETGGGTTADTVEAITSDALISLVYALKRPYRKSASWIINDSLMAEIRKLKDDDGQYIWQKSYQEGEPDRLLGYPVHTSQYAPEDGVAFGDYSYYNIGDRGTRSIQQLNELFAGNGLVAFVAKERVDGKLVLAEAVQILRISASEG